MIKIAICDYYHMCEDVIRNYIRIYMEEKNIAYELINHSVNEDLRGDFDDIIYSSVVFINISKNRPKGIDVAKTIRRLSGKVQIVFVTDCMDYLMEGYKVNAVRCLLENSDNFKWQLFECMDEVIERINYVEKCILVPFVGGDMRIAINNIVYIESRAHRLTFYMAVCEKSELYTYMRLMDAEQMLKDYKFIRIHQSYLVNPNYIKVFDEQSVELLIWNRKLPVSRKRSSRAKKLFAEYKERQI